MKKCIDCGAEFESKYQDTDICDECFNAMIENEISSEERGYELDRR